MVAEWLNAADCNFVPISVRRFKSFPPQKRMRKKEKEDKKNGKSRSSTSEKKERFKSIQSKKTRDWVK